jgi:hypothetical protein
MIELESFTRAFKLARNGQVKVTPAAADAD